VRIALTHTGLAVAVLALFPPFLPAQVNIERLRRTDLDHGFAGQAALDFTLRAGNVDLVLLAPSGRVDYTAGQWDAFLVARGDFGWQHGERFSNQALAHLRFGWRSSPRVTLEAFTQWDYDRSRRLTHRALIGAGPRLTLAATPAWRVAVGTAYLFEHEKRDLSPGSTHPAETHAHRWSSYFTAHGRSGERLAAVATLYAQPRFDDFADLRLLADGRLAVQLAGTLSLQLSTLLRWDGRPPDDTDRLDLTLRTGLGIEW
jgi:hypothetical protein